MSRRKYSYPTCRKGELTENWFGTRLPDPYAWFRNQYDPEVLDFVSRENAFTDAYFADFPVSEKIRELKEQQLPPLPSNIAPWGEGYIASFTLEGEFAVRILDAGLTSTRELPTISGLEEMQLFSAAPCPNNPAILALMVQRPGDARPTMAVCHTEERSVLLLVSDVFSFCWAEGDGCLYYSVTFSDTEMQSCRSVFRRYDPSSKEDRTIFEDHSNAIFGQVFPSSDGAWVMAMLCHDYALADWAAIHTSDQTVTLLTEQPVEWKYIDSTEKGHCFINVSGSSRGSVICVTAPGSQRVLLPESELMLNDGFSADGKLFVLAWKDVNSLLLELTPKTKASAADSPEAPDVVYREIPLPEKMGTLTRAGKAQGGVFLRYESFLTAPCILHFDGKELRPILRSSLREHPDLTAEQHFAPSTGDHTPIPYYLVRRKDAPRDGNQPVLMYAYGGYNTSMPPWYQEMVTQIVVSDWVEKGGIYVHAHIRGGNEYGPAWHEAGMGKNKRHCYEDFIGIAEEMIREGWTRAGRIGICGCSNGGLLMSALLTMRPDLWGCVIDSVPHTDMIHFAEDDRGPMYITEYGNPRENREMFDYLLSYSPYHNIRQTDYPPTYIQTGEKDNNVPPYHGKKFAAGLQEANTSEAPILLRVLADGAHDRGQGEVFWRTIAEMQLFLEHWLLA